MIINKRRILKSIIFLAIFGVVISVGYHQMQKRRQVDEQVFFVTGIQENQTGIVEELKRSATEYNYIQRGHEYFKNGEYDKAIEQYNIVLERNKKTASLINARSGLIDAYEKKREYKKAHDLLFDIVSRYVTPPTDKFRIPDDERLKYLDYASKGEYELAVKHAELALEANLKLPTSTQERYEDRLSDIKASKEYIESLNK